MFNFPLMHRLYVVCNLLTMNFSNLKKGSVQTMEVVIITHLLSLKYNTLFSKVFTN